MNLISVIFVNAAGALLLFFSLNLSADDLPWYHVEIIVFEQLTSTTDERWSAGAAYKVPSSILTPQSKTLLIRPSEELALRATTSRLQRSSAYRVHYHDAWQQAAIIKRDAKAVKVSSDNGLVNGYIKLYRSTYLHVTIDLWLKQNLSVMDNDDNNGMSYPNLNESRRIKKETLHFFDHPKMGVLLKIMPVALPPLTSQQGDTVSTIDDILLPTVYDVSQ